MAAPSPRSSAASSSSTPRSPSSTTARSAPARGRSSSATRPGSASSSASRSTSSTAACPRLLDGARAALADYLGCSAEDLAFVQNATTGVNLAARSLDLGPGDEVLATDLEYGACDLAWEWVCRRSGRAVRPGADPAPARRPAELVDALFARGERAARASSTSATSRRRPALVLPVEEIVARARALGLVTIVDGAHAPAQVPVDLDALGADFYSGNAHKWLCAPKGAGFLHVRPEHQERVDAAIVSWGYARGSTFSQRIEMQGTRDPAAWLAVPDAIRFQAERDWDAVRERCRRADPRGPPRALRAPRHGAARAGVDARRRWRASGSPAPPPTSPSGCSRATASRSRSPARTRSPPALRRRLHDARRDRPAASRPRSGA